MSAFHLDVWAMESVSLEGDARWLSWLRTAERVSGIADLDGDDSEEARAAGTSDGYSLDGAFDAYRAGTSPEDYGRDVRKRVEAIQANLRG